MTIISTSDFFDTVPPQFFLVMIFLIIIIMPVMFILMKNIMKNADNSKPLITKRVKIIERRPQKNGVALFSEYSIETDTGERLILRNYDEKTLILKEGDQGIMSYCGKTIKSFKRD